MKLRFVMFKQQVPRGDYPQQFTAGLDTKTGFDVSLSVDSQLRFVKVTDHLGTFLKPFDDVQWCEPLDLVEDDGARLFGVNRDFYTGPGVLHEPRWMKAYEDAMKVEDAKMAELRKDAEGKIVDWAVANIKPTIDRQFEHMKGEANAVEEGKQQEGHQREHRDRAKGRKA